jgi:hypothetical protein
MEAEWDRLEKRYVRTSLTEAFAEMTRRGILWSRGWEISRKRALAELSRRGANSFEQKLPVLGYAYYTFLGQQKRLRGKDFPLYFGQFEQPRFRAAGLSSAEVGQVVCECLGSAGVQFHWDQNPDRPIQVITASITCLSQQE